MKMEMLDRISHAIRVSAYAVYTGLLRGNLTARERQISDRIRDCREGDLVVEITTGPAHRKPDIRGVGILLKVCREPVKFSDTDFVWDEAVEGQPHPTEKVYYIQTLDGNECRWTNASFIVCLEDMSFLNL